MLPVFGTQCRVIFRLRGLVCEHRGAQLAHPSTRFFSSFMVGGVICLSASLSWGGQVDLLFSDSLSILTSIYAIGSPGVCVGVRGVGVLVPSDCLPSDRYSPVAV